jgi:hypothetical protein
LRQESPGRSFFSTMIAALAAADDHDIGLRLVAERLRLVLAFFLPGPGADVLAVLGAERTREARLLLMTLQLDHRGEQGPDQAVLDTDKAEAARHGGLELDPGGGDAAVLARFLAVGDLPARRIRKIELRL